MSDRTCWCGAPSLDQHGPPHCSACPVCGESCCAVLTRAEADAYAATWPRTTELRLRAVLEVERGDTARLCSRCLADLWTERRADPAWKYAGAGKLTRVEVAAEAEAAAAVKRQKHAVV